MAITTPRTNRAQTRFTDDAIYAVVRGVNATLRFARNRTGDEYGPDAVYDVLEVVEDAAARRPDGGMILDAAREVRESLGSMYIFPGIGLHLPGVRWGIVGAVLDQVRTVA